MKVFISSLISGFEPFRAAARAAVMTLRHEPIMAEDFAARPASPQITCMQGVRSSDLILLILGEHYGTVQGVSGVSPTHEEFLEAKGKKNVLVFVQQGVNHDLRQSKLIAEVQAWQGGYFRIGFTTPDQLRDAIIQALHDYQLANAAAPLDLRELAATAAALLPRTGRNRHSERAMLNVAIASGPIQRILRPAELEDTALIKKIHQQALFSTSQLFDETKGMSSDIEGDALFLEQEDGARILLNERGGLLLRLPLERNQNQRGFGFSAIIQENVVRELTTGLAFANWMLEAIDPSQRITHVATAASIEASDYMPWRTQAEQDASPNSGTMGSGRGDDERMTAQATWARAALRLEAHRLAEDIMVHLRRLWKKR